MDLFWSRLGDNSVVENGFMLPLQYSIYMCNTLQIRQLRTDAATIPLLQHYNNIIAIKLIIMILISNFF